MAGVGTAAAYSQGLAVPTKAVTAGSLRQGTGVRSLIVKFPQRFGPSQDKLSTSRRCRRNILCASKDDRPGSDDRNLNEGEKGPVDWDKAWESFPKPKKRDSFKFKSLFKVDMEKYVNRKPTQSKFPLSEEIDPLRKTERAVLDIWTDPKFTLAGVGVVVGLFVYMVVIVGPPPV